METEASQATLMAPTKELSPEDLYTKFKKLQQQLEFLAIQEECIKTEQRNLKKEYLHAQEEVKRIQSVPLVIGQFLEAVDQNTGIVGSTTGSNYYVRILSTLDRELLKPSASVALHKHSNALVDVLPPEADSSISMLQPDEKPDVSYADIGGMDMQKQEMKEAVELPLTHFELYKQIGIDPPRGVLMYGPPGKCPNSAACQSLSTLRLLMFFFGKFSPVNFASEIFQPFFIFEDQFFTRGFFFLLKKTPVSSLSLPT